MTKLVITQNNVYNLSPLPTKHKAWKYVDGAKVRPAHKPEGDPWIILQRLSVAPFPHYEVMDDQGHLWIMPQLALVNA